MESISPIIVVKIGGSTLSAEDTSLIDLVTLQQQGVQPVVVHGGGPEINDWMVRLGVPVRFEGGLRVTDEPSLEVVAAVLGGLINKRLVAKILKQGGSAVGISGTDGGILQGTIQDPNLGFVASQVEVDPRPLQILINGGYIPVIAPLAIQRSGNGNLLNVNGDTAAAAIAVAMGASNLVFLTDVNGVLDGNGRLIERIAVQEVQGLLESGVAKLGMVPKLQSSFYAASHNVPSVIVNGTRPSVLLDCMNGLNVGTAIR